MKPATTTLWRPVGPKELDLIAASGFRRFPPRLPEQPIFYPVCNETYAVEIAERWNAKSDGGGFVPPQASGLTARAADATSARPFHGRAAVHFSLMAASLRQFASLSDGEA